MLPLILRIFGALQDKNGNISLTRTGGTTLLGIGVDALSGAATTPELAAGTAILAAGTALIWKRGEQPTVEAEPKKKASK
jgi:nitrate reductase gamma subunit